MNKYWLIKEFSKLTGVTVRALHYYDGQDILKPHHKSDSGYRYYSLTELATLKKISVLKDLGFNLQQIKTILLSDTADWAYYLKLQATAVEQEINSLRHKLNLINSSMNNNASRNNNFHGQIRNPANG